MRKWFSQRVAQDRIDQKDLVSEFCLYVLKMSLHVYFLKSFFFTFAFQILFPTLDPPPKGFPNAVGHWVVVTLNLERQCFQYIDSLYDEKQHAGWAIYRRMVANIKRLWTDLDPPLEPLSIDHFPTNYMGTVKQTDQ